jgi:hypothetical protein
MGHGWIAMNLTEALIESVVYTHTVIEGCIGPMIPHLQMVLSTPEVDT